MGSVLAVRSNSVIASDAEVLKAIRGNGINIAIWARPAIPGPGQLDLGSLTSFRFTTPIGSLSENLQKSLCGAGYRPGLNDNILVTDILMLAGRFSDAVGADDIEIRLEIINNDACRKFHADYVTARLITTYIGQGTQWLSADDAARFRDGQEPRNVRQLAVGHVALFKGWMWSAEDPILHRSPPILGTGESRLVLVINPVG